MPSPFIDDGYTREALLPETDRHPAVHFAYRPMLAAERRRLALQTMRLAARGKGGLDAAAELVAAAVATRLVSWDVTDETTNDAERPLAIEPATVAALEPELFEKVATVITSFDDEGSTAKN